MYIRNLLIIFLIIALPNLALSQALSSPDEAPKKVKPISFRPRALACWMLPG